MQFCIKQLKQQVEIGARGVIFHLPKLTAEEIAPKYKELLDMKPAKSMIVLENKAVRPAEKTSFETPEKLNHLVDTFIKYGIDQRDIALCIDTAHLHCSGVDLKMYDDAKKWLSELKYPRTIKLIHLNGNSSSGYADKHVIAFDKDDKIWGSIPFEKSGARAIKEFCKDFKIDIILECDFENETAAAVDLVKLLKK
jgi:endonuclease IV